ncbi:HepT-like ribonuclease domain-containing protein [Cellulomonas chengniuliangii]|uniref:HepT-like ribonuclease domain-containing protein n=1 Tax=Cellulomonas chengniuliangii TaxID=2968084 RepID=UPI001D0DF521|nr:HepT-like ribonuclease domain-containing protein [Cellulomonas chengniuliangii]MCC2318799.1 DUF86 domain-containing protein [Cellulomonas chengniuliangii]
MTTPPDSTGTPPIEDEGEGRIALRLDDLASMGRLVAGIVGKGEDAYLDEGIDGQILRAAGRAQIVDIATVAEKLPAEFKDRYPDVEWVKIQRMRNLIAHHYDKVIDDFVWETLRTRIPELIAVLGLTGR